MPDTSRPAGTSIAIIAAVVAVLGVAFGYAAGWLTPSRVTPAKIVDALAPPGGPAEGLRRNHAKGICFTGMFEANGAGVALSKAQMFSQGSYPVVGRFNLATPDPHVADGTQRVRGLSLQVTTPDRQEWRSAMIDAPFFPVATPQAFYELLQASAHKDDPEAMKRFAGAHPEIGAFGAWAASAPISSSYADDRYNSLNSFTLTDASGSSRVVRWSFVPAATPVLVPMGDLAKHAPDFLEQEIIQKVAAAPQRWTMQVTVAESGDPTADPSKAWPEGRRSVAVGTLSVQAIQPEAGGPCRDLNFDPTVLPPGMSTSDDPFPAARSATYSVSFNRRTAEPYPATASGAKP